MARRGANVKNFGPAIEQPTEEDPHGDDAVVRARAILRANLPDIIIGLVKDAKNRRLEPRDRHNAIRLALEFSNMKLEAVPVAQHNTIDRALIVQLPTMSDEDLLSLVAEHAAARLGPGE